MSRYKSPAIEFLCGPQNVIKTDSSRVVFDYDKITIDIITALMVSYGFILVEHGKAYTPREFAIELAQVCDVNMNARNRFFLHVLIELEFWNIVLDGFDERDRPYTFRVNKLTAAVYRVDE